MRNMTICTAAATLIAMGLSAATATAQTPNLSDGGVRLVSSKPFRSFHKMAIEGQDAVYVSPSAAISQRDVLEIELLEVSGGKDIVLTLEPRAAARLTSAIKQQGANSILFAEAGKVLGIGKIDVDLATGQATITGLAADRALRVSGMIQRDLIGATVIITPKQNAIQPGDIVEIDILMNGAANLRAYQVGLTISGGASGNFTTEDVVIQGKRPDYVFAGMQKVDAVDKKGDRLGGALFSGGKTVDKVSYLGTFKLRASADAAGTFVIGVKGDDTTSFLNARNLKIMVAPRAAKITVGSQSSIRPAGK